MKNPFVIWWMKLSFLGYIKEKSKRPFNQPATLNQSHTIHSIRPFKQSIIPSSNLFSNFAGKHLCWSLFYYKVAAVLKPATLLKRDSTAGVFLWSFMNTYFKEHLLTAASDCKINGKIGATRKNRTFGLDWNALFRVDKIAEKNSN